MLKISKDTESNKNQIKLNKRNSFLHELYTLTLKVTGQATAAKENSSCLRSTNIEQGAAEGGSESLG